VSTQVPALLARLVDDAAVFPPGNAPLPEAVAAHRQHRDAWYADLVGPLVLPASAVAAGELTGGGPPVRGLTGGGPSAGGSTGGGLTGGGPTVAPAGLEVGLIADHGIDRLPSAVAVLGPAGVVLRQVEAAVGKRGEDPRPGLDRLVGLCAGWPGASCYAEIPLSWGVLAALDAVAAARADGVDVSPKFRTGGLAAELFPTPVELAAVICACRDRRLRFKLTAGLHRAVRHTDPETGFAHHGFLNVLVASVVAGAGAEVAEVAAVLGGTDALPLVEHARRIRDRERPLWTGFGTCSIPEPLADLTRLGLL
jgi:hypothetical protein